MAVSATVGEKYDVRTKATNEASLSRPGWPFTSLSATVSSVGSSSVALPVSNRLPMATAKTPEPRVI